MGKCRAQIPSMGNHTWLYITSLSLFHFHLLVKSAPEPVPHPLQRSLFATGRLGSSFARIEKAISSESGLELITIKKSKQNKKKRIETSSGLTV